MEKNTLRIDELNSLLYAIGGYFGRRNRQGVLAVLKKVILLEEGAQKDMNYDERYELMLRVASDFKIHNPFPEKEKFIDGYNALKKINGISWTDILAYKEDIFKYRIPASVVDEMEKNFIDGFQKVLITEAEKFSSLLERIVKSHDHCHFTLTTSDSFYYKLLCEIFAGNEMVEIKETNIYQYEFLSEKFDLILSVPSFGLRDKAPESSAFICRKYEMIAAENLALHLNSGGVLSIVLPASITFASDNVKELREFLQSMYCLKEIAGFPSGLFRNLKSRTYLVTITTGRTDEVTIKRFVFEDENARKQGHTNLILQDETFVLEDELIDMGDWNIDRIFEVQDEDWIKFRASNVKKQALGTVASIFRGKVVKDKDANGNIGVINITNIGDYEIDYSSLDHIEIEERKVTTHILQTGDLLIPGRGTSIRIAVFEEQAYPCIASSNIIVIRAIDERLSTTYLKLFFDTSLGRKMLLTRQPGTATMNISYKELNSVEIPLPSMEEQQAISEEYRKEFKIYKEALQEAETRWSSTLARLQARI